MKAPFLVLATPLTAAAQRAPQFARLGWPCALGLLGLPRCMRPPQVLPEGRAIGLPGALALACGRPFAGGVTRGNDCHRWPCGHLY